MTGLRHLELPPVWLIAFMAAMAGVAHAVPLAVLPASRWVGGLVIGAAMLVMLWAVMTMLRARTTVIPRRAPEALVAGGPFRFSRNPIYLADALVLVGWAVWLGALSAWLLVPLFPLVIARRFIAGEEAALAARFGAAWDDYAARVRRWL